MSKSSKLKAAVDKVGAEQSEAQPSDQAPRVRVGDAVMPWSKAPKVRLGDAVMPW